MLFVSEVVDLDCMLWDIPDEGGRAVVAPGTAAYREPVVPDKAVAPAAAADTPAAAAVGTPAAVVAAAGTLAVVVADTPVVAAADTPAADRAVGGRVEQNRVAALAATLVPDCEIPR